MTPAAVLRPRAWTFLRLARAVARNPADEDAVHDARVAGRRLAAAGDLWAPSIRGWRGMRRRLRKAVRRLGDLRDLDVSIGLLRRGSAADRAERRVLAASLDELRGRERPDARDFLGERIPRLAARTERVLRRCAGAEPPKAEALRPRFERILMYAASAKGPEDAHRIRREIRRLRYSHETLQPLYAPERFARASRLLRRIQEAAGAWQDRCVLLARLARKAPRLRRRLLAEARGLERRFLASVRPLAAARGLFLET